MKKFYLSLAISLLTMVSWAGEVTFDFSSEAGLAAMGITAPAQSNGVNITDCGAITRDGVTLTAINGGTATRVWNSQGSYTLRVYVDGAVTLSVAQGSIVGVVINPASTSNFTFNATVGSLEVTNAAATWTGSTASVSFYHTGSKNAQVKSIKVITSNEAPQTGGGGVDDTKYQLDSLVNLASLPDGTEFQMCTPTYVNYVNGDYLYLMQMDDDYYCYAALVYGATGASYKMGDVIPAGWTAVKTTYKGLVEATSPAGFGNAIGTVSEYDYLPFEVTDYLDYVLDPEEGWENFKIIAHHVTLSPVDAKGNFTVTGMGSQGENVTIKGYNKWNVDYPATVAGVFDLEAMVSVYDGVYELFPISITSNENEVRLWELLYDSQYDGCQVTVLDTIYVAHCVPQEKVIYVTDNATSIFADFGYGEEYIEWYPSWTMLKLDGNEELYNKVASMKVLAPGTLKGIVDNPGYNMSINVTEEPVELPGVDVSLIILEYDLGNIYLYGNECISVKGTFDSKQGQDYVVGSDEALRYHLNYDYAPALAGTCQVGDEIELCVIARLKMSWEDWYMDDTPAPAKCKAPKAISKKIATRANQVDASQNYEFYVLSIDKTNAVNDVDAAAQVATIEYINTLGQASLTPHQGLNIVKTTYTNGTTTTVKVMK